MAPTMKSPVGYWGVPTSTLDWCESNYSVTIFIAEFWNTVSNIAMILPSLMAFYGSYRNGTEKRFMLCYVFLGLVGFGSWAFHMTLLYEMQLFDEIPMLWGALILLYCLLSIVYPFVDRSPMMRYLTQLCLILYGVIATAAYLGLKTPLLFQMSYGFLVALMLYFDICIAKYRPCDVRLFYSAAIIYYTGFALWNIDNIFCDYLEQMRQLIPSIFGPFTQFHALWHCLAGYGSYLHIIYCAHSRALSMKKNAFITYDWSGIKLQISDSNKLL